MGATVGLPVLVVIALAMILIGYGVKNNDDNDGASLFGIGVVLLMISMLTVGVIIGENEVKKVKHKVTPVIKVECMNTKCDTTYIYSFKEEEQ